MKRAVEKKIDKLPYTRSVPAEGEEESLRQLDEIVGFDEWLQYLEIDMLLSLNESR